MRDRSILIDSPSTILGNPPHQVQTKTMVLKSPTPIKMRAVYEKVTPFIFRKTDDWAQLSRDEMTAQGNGLVNDQEKRLRA
jgi:hypothetical protein